MSSRLPRGLPWLGLGLGLGLGPPMACHGVPHGAIESYATPWDAVGMLWYAMGDTMAMPRKSQIVLNPDFLPSLTHVELTLL